MKLTKEQRRRRIKSRIRKIVAGTPERPRLSIYRSNKEIYAQLVDDVNGKTLGACTSLNNKVAYEGAKIDQAAAVGKAIAQLAKDKGIEAVVFDRNGYLYHGRVKALAEAAREGGLQF
ncbi:MAG: 50S ribosomal protein L18 [Bacteroidetes bacterium]|jgi:large subunit ribosomal protein L18|nr:50S ribosomal protein L18 [Bacteroidota bacterium]